MYSELTFISKKMKKTNIKIWFINSQICIFNVFKNVKSKMFIKKATIRDNYGNINTVVLL